MTLRLPSVVLALLAIACARDAVAADEVIGVLPLEVSGRMPASRDDLETAVIKGLAIAGRALLPSAESAARATRVGARLACSTPDCWGALGRALEVTHVVSGGVERAERAYRARFQIVEVTTGRVLRTEENSCEIADCSLPELARLSARELVRHGLARLAPPERAATPVPAQEARVTEPSPAAPPAISPARTWAAALLVGAGAIAAGAGAFVLSRDGRAVDPARADGYVQDTWLGGTLTLGGGAALAIAGVVLFVHDRVTGPGVTVALSPAGVAVGGRY